MLEEKISGRFSDEAGEWFDVTPALPKTSAGAPVIDHRGEVIGIVSFRAGNNSCAIRPAATAGTLLAQVSSNTIATWQTLTNSSHLRTPTASPTTTRSPTPAKIPLRGSKLIYAPVPRYPRRQDVEERRLGQFPRFVRCKWACRRSSDATLDRQFSRSTSGRFRTSRVAFGTRAGVESGRANNV